MKSSKWERIDVNNSSLSISSNTRSPSVLTIPAHDLLHALVDKRAAFIADHGYLPYTSFASHGMQSSSS